MQESIENLKFFNAVFSVAKNLLFSELKCHSNVKLKVLSSKYLTQLQRA